MKELRQKNRPRVFEHTARGLVSRITDALGQEASLEYDALGNIVKITAPGNAVTLYAYDAAGRVLQTTDPVGCVTEYGYDAAGQLVRVAVNGHATAYEYNAAGNIATVTDAEGNSAAFEYDLLGRMTAVIYADGSRDGYAYDALGRLTKQEDRSGVTTEYGYDENGNLLRAASGGMTTEYEYDLLNRLTAKITADGRTEYAYDAAGRLTAETDALGNVTKYEYDVVSQLTAVEYANGARVTAAYDLNGNAERETDAMGHETTYAYDAADRLIAVTDALGNETRYEYDVRDNIAKVIDALGHETQYTYDAAGQLVAEKDALGNTTRYAYTSEGWLREVTKPDGNTITYTYDKTGQLTREEYSDARVVSFEYNEIGRLTVTEGPEGRTEYQYDGNGRLVSVAYPDGDVVQYGYDANGRRESLTYPSGGEVTYAYDSMGRLATVTGLDGEETRYAYDALGRRTESANRTLKTEYIYDSVGDIVRQRTTGGTNVELLYDYDLNGMLTREQRTESGETITSEYVYDPLGRIASFTTDRDGGYSERYSYDAAGNMLEKWVNDTQISMTYNAANQLTGMESANGAIAYSYSPNGDMVGKALNVGSGSYKDSYAYDVAGNLTSYTGYDSYEVKYSYTALNMLMEKTATGNPSRATLEEVVSGKGELPETKANTETVTTRYTYDILQIYYNVLTETSNDITTEYEYGLERIAAYTASDAESVKTQYVYDVRGSVIQTMTGKAAEHIAEAITTPTIQSYAYTPFGEQIGAKISGYGYNGEYYDAATGLLNLRARQYEPAMMRFSQPDILISTDEIYKYCKNNPVIYADYNGLECVVISGGIYRENPKTEAEKITAYNFIESSLKEIYDLREETDEKIAWIIADTGWTERDKANFIETASSIENVTVVFVNSASQCTSYINTGNSKEMNGNAVSIARINDPISYVSVFSHGIIDDGGKVTLGYNYGERNTSLDITKETISGWSSQSFKSAIVKLYSCNAGTEHAYSIAHAISSTIDATVYAYSGKSRYTNIVYPELSFVEKVLNKIFNNNKEIKSVEQLRSENSRTTYITTGALRSPVAGYGATPLMFSQGNIFEIDSIPALRSSPSIIRTYPQMPQPGPAPTTHPAATPSPTKTGNANMGSLLTKNALSNIISKSVKNAGKRVLSTLSPQSGMLQQSNGKGKILKTIKSQMPIAIK